MPEYELQIRKKNDYRWLHFVTSTDLYTVQKLADGYLDDPICKGDRIRIVERTKTVKWEGFCE